MVEEVLASQRRVEQALQRLVEEVAALRGGGVPVPERLLAVCTSAATDDPALRGRSRVSSAGDDSQGQLPSVQLALSNSAKLLRQSSLEHNTSRIFTPIETASSDEGGKERPSGPDMVPGGSGATLVPFGLPTDWPACVGKRDFGGDDAVDTRAQYQLLHATPSQRSPSDASRDAGAWTEALGNEGNSNHCVQVTFAVMSFAMVLHDLILLPYALAWQLDFDGYFMVATFVSVAYWGADILGKLFLPCILQAKRGARVVCKEAYARTWFVLDLSLLASDAVCIVLESSAILRTEGLSRTGRLLRMVDVIRVIRIGGSIREALARPTSEGLQAFLRVLLLVSGLMWLTHVLACCWYAIGTAMNNGAGDHWLEAEVKVDGVSVTYAEAGPTFQYFTCMHWAVQQVVLAGAIDISCTNATERGFSVLCLTIGFICGSTVISFLSASMVEFQSRNQDRDQKMRSLRRYLRKHMVGPGITLRVIQQVEDRLQARESSDQAAGLVMDLLSTRLRAQLHAEICKQSLTAHPLLFLWKSMDDMWFERFCTEVVKIAVLREEDDLFTHGTPATSASVLTRGDLKYTRATERHNSRNFEESSEVVPPGTWLSESALWCEWVHTGTATACVVSEVLLVNAVNFAQACRGHRIIRAIAAEYGKQYHRRVVTAMPPLGKYPTDLAVPFTDFGELVNSMPQGIRQGIGIHSIHHGYTARTTRIRSSAGEQTPSDLMKEVRMGKSTVVLEHGRLVRIVAVLILRIQRDDGAILTEIGKVNDGVLVAECQLPGGKPHSGEVLEAALVRIVSSKLSPIEGNIIPKRLEFTRSETTSNRFAVHTKYLRTVCSADFHGPCNLPQCKMPDDSVLLWPSHQNTEFDFTQILRNTGSLSTRSLMDELLQGPIFYVGSPGSGTFYAWLQPGVEENVRRSGNFNVQLEALLSSLRLPSSGTTTAGSDSMQLMSSGEEDPKEMADTESYSDFEMSF